MEGGIIMAGFGIDEYEERVPCPFCESTDCACVAVVEKAGTELTTLYCGKTGKSPTHRQLLASARKHGLTPRKKKETEGKPFPDTSAWWVCVGCGAEWSAAMSDDQVPETCECGGLVVENSENGLDRLRRVRDRLNEILGENEHETMLHQEVDRRQPERRDRRTPGGRVDQDRSDDRRGDQEGPRTLHPRTPEEEEMTTYIIDLVKTDRTSLEIEAANEHDAISEAIRRASHTDIGIDIDYGDWGVDHVTEATR
jgi:hypothetical protein